MGTEETRRRILEAVVGLHEEVGPADTTVTAIAERAGVQRLTVYRHFPDERALVHGCSAHWSEQHSPPDPGSWAGNQDPRRRLDKALRELYAYYDGGAEMMGNILRDEEKVPALREVLAPWWGYLSEAAGGLAAGWGAAADRQRRVRAAVGHALRFSTWRSLRDEDLANQEAVDLMVELVVGVATGAERGSQPPRKPRTE